VSVGEESWPENAELVALEVGLATALRAGDPEAALARLAADTSFGAQLQARVASIEVDGFRLAALLVARLRFERLVQGAERASRWFDDDPAGFAAAFRRYHAEVPATAHFPADEALLFDAWTQRSADTITCGAAGQVS